MSVENPLVYPSERRTDYSQGLSLRDHAAVQIAAGLASREFHEPPEVIARKAYAVADAMLKVRKQ